MTLFFMPHCELFLYDSVLGANATRGMLASAAVLGNSFAMYVSREALKPDGPPASSSWLLRLQPVTTGAPCASRCLGLVVHGLT